MEWTKYETHKERMETLIQSKNPPNQTITSSIDEIQSFINRIHNLGTSYAEWLQTLTRHFYNPTRNTPTTYNNTPIQPGRASNEHDRHQSRTSTRSHNSRHSRHSRRSKHSRASSKSSKPRSPVSPPTPSALGAVSFKHGQRPRAKTPNPSPGHAHKFESSGHHPRGYKIRQSGNPGHTAYHQRTDASAIVTPVSVNISTSAVKSPKSHSRSHSSRTISPRSPPTMSRPATPRPKPLPPPSMKSRSPKPPPPRTPKQNSIPHRIMVAGVHSKSHGSSRKRSKNTKGSMEFPPISPIEKPDRSMNIQPSTARRLSGNMMSNLPQKKKKHKKKAKSSKRKKKSKKVKKDRDSRDRNEGKMIKSRRDRQSSTPASGSSQLQSQTSPSSPYYRGLEADAMMMLSSSEPNLLDYDRDTHNHNDDDNGYQSHHDGDLHGSHVHHQRKYTSKSKSRETTKHTNSGTESTFVSGSGGFPALPALNDKNSLRSFGELFSKQFQRNVCHAYRKSLQNIDDQTVLDCDNDNEMAGFVELKRDVDDDEVVVIHPITVSIPNIPITAKQTKIAQYFHDDYHGQNGVFM